MATLHRVTITGADDSVAPEALVELSREFPFVEWGILAADEGRVEPRFPEMAWIARLKSAFAAAATRPSLALHLCGRWVGQLLVGKVTFPAELIEDFDRVQLNFREKRSRVELDELVRAMRGMAGRQWIVPISASRPNLTFEALLAEREKARPIVAVPLYDSSGGIGKLPDAWPAPRYATAPHLLNEQGYAGGLGPMNLTDEIPKILSVAGAARVWIDMETRVRSDDDRLFDLSKVRTCLEAARPHVAVDGNAAPSRSRGD